MSKNAGSKFLGGWQSIILVSLVIILSIASCSKKSTKETTEYNPTINPADFVSEINNPYLPLVPGTTFTYLGVRDTMPDSNVVVVTHETRNVVGVTCVVVHDLDYRGGELA